jgi:hypothetical protein
MAKLNLTAHGSNEKIILDYLTNNASESLAERINNGKKTLTQCWNYIMHEARKQAVNGCACIEDSTVFGWAIHFFEEDSIKAEKFNKTPSGTATTSSKKQEEKVTEVGEQPKKAPTKKPKPKETFVNAEQIGFDFGGMIDGSDED